MRREIFGRLLAWLLAAVPGTAWSLEDCGPYVAEIDQKIAAAEAAGHDAQVARELREQIPQMCAFLDEASLRAMIDGLDQLLPFLSEVTAQAELAEAARTAAEPSTAGLQSVPETGRSLGGGLIARPDAMHHFGIWDMDVHQGRARVTYHTRPDRLQAARDDWEYVSYVAVVDRAGAVTQRLLDRRQFSDQGGLALRRGADEIVMQWQRGMNGKDPALERYSVASGEMLSRAPAPMPPWPGSGSQRREPFQSVTAAGTLLYIGTEPAPGNASEHTLAWFEASPEGQVLSAGAITRQESIGAPFALESRHGGGASVLQVGALADDGIATRLTTPIRRQVAGRQIYATVSMEKRLLVVDGSTFWESPALERMLMWQGELAVPQGLGPAEMMRQSQAQMDMMAEADLAYAAGRSVASLNVGFKQVEMIRPLVAGRFVALVNQVADRQLVPPRHGQYLLSVTEQAIQELAYLEPLAEQQEVKFTALATSPAADAVYLLAVPRGGGVKRIYRFGADGQPQGYGSTEAGQAITLEGLVADQAGVWAFGRGTPEGVIGERLWAERLTFAVP